MTATVTIKAAGKAVMVQKMNPATSPTVKIGPRITIPPETELVLHVFETQGLAIMEAP